MECFPIGDCIWVYLPLYIGVYIVLSTGILVSIILESKSFVLLMWKTKPSHVDCMNWDTRYKENNTHEISFGWLWIGIKYTRDFKENKLEVGVAIWPIMH